MKNTYKMMMLALSLCALVAATATWFCMLGKPSKVASVDDLRLRLAQSIREADWIGIDHAASDWMRSSPNHEEAARLRGYAAFALGRVTEAEGHFLRSGSPVVQKPGDIRSPLLSEGDDGSPVGLLIAADHAARMGDVQGARERISKALDLAPSLSVARLFRASLDTRADRLEAALGDLALISKQDSVWHEARLLQALIHLSQGLNYNAKEELQTLLETQSSQPLAFNTLGVLRALDGKWSEAADAFAKAYSSSPQFTDARRNWRLAHGAANAPGTVVALRMDVQEANGRAMAAISEGYAHSIAAARDTAMGNTMRDLSPYAKGAGAAGAYARNPWVAISGVFAGEWMNRTGEKSLQSASRNADVARLADQEWDKAIMDIMRIGAERYPGSPQARAYENRLARVQVSPAPRIVSSQLNNSGVDSRGGVSADLSEAIRRDDGSVVYRQADGTSQELIVVYPIFMNQ